MPLVKPWQKMPVLKTLIHMKKVGRKPLKNKEELKKLGEALRKIRKLYKLTQEEMALRLGVNPRTYQRYEKGEVSPYSIFPKLEEEFGITEYELKKIAGLYPVEEDPDKIEQEFLSLLKALPKDKKVKVLKMFKEQLELIAV